MSFASSKITERFTGLYTGDLSKFVQYETGLKHNCHVIATVPKENLLVWDLKEGWEPLCKFLNKPIPDQERNQNIPGLGL